jgi:hypothetical protein
MNIVLQPRPLFVLGLNVWMGTDAGADELVEVPSQIILLLRLATCGRWRTWGRSSTATPPPPEPRNLLWRYNPM